MLIPSFSIGRTQELLYELAEIMHEQAERTATPCLDSPGQLAQQALDVNWRQLPILLDSPLASQFTTLYKELQDYWDKDAVHRLKEGRKPLSFKQLITVDTHDEHTRIVDRLRETGRPAVVIAGNGMCSRANRQLPQAIVR